MDDYITRDICELKHKEIEELKQRFYTYMKDQNGKLDSIHSRINSLVKWAVGIFFSLIATVISILIASLK